MRKAMKPKRKPPSDYRRKYTVSREERMHNRKAYASKAEANRAAELDLLKRAGQIRNWSPQPMFDLGCPAWKYTADFQIQANDGKWWVEDVKSGVETERFRHHVACWKKRGRCPLHILRANRRGGWIVEVIEGGADQRNL